MSKFKRDITASDKQDPFRKLIQLQKLFARREVLRSGNFQVCRFLSGCNDHIAPFYHFGAHLNRGPPDEMGASVECRYAGFRKAFFPVLGNRLSERSLEAHQLLPINLKFLGLNSFSFH